MTGGEANRGIINQSGPRSTRESKTVGVSFSCDSAQSLCSSLDRSPRIIGVHAIILGLALRTDYGFCFTTSRTGEIGVPSSSFSEIKKGILDTNARNNLFSTAEIR